MTKRFIFANTAVAVSIILTLSSWSGKDCNVSDSDKIVAIYNDGIKQLMNATDIDEIIRIGDEVHEKVRAVIDTSHVFKAFYDAMEIFENSVRPLYYFPPEMPDTALVATASMALLTLSNNTANKGVIIYKNGLERIKNATKTDDVEKICDEVHLKICRFMNSDKDYRSITQTETEFNKVYIERTEKASTQL